MSPQQQSKINRDRISKAEAEIYNMFSGKSGEEVANLVKQLNTIRVLSFQRGCLEYQIEWEKIQNKSLIFRS